MRFETSQHMKLGQQMKLAPRMIQSMEILQMPLAELEERIDQELASNPTLELQENEPDADELRRMRDERAEEQRDAAREIEHDESGGDDFARLDSFEQANPEAADNAFDDSYDTRRDGEIWNRDRIESRNGASSRLDGEPDAKLEAMSNAPARGESLPDQLVRQWGMVEVDPRLRPLGEAIIAFLDEDGYLRTPLEEVRDKAPPPAGLNGSAASWPPPIERWEDALQAVQLFLEPAGIAARDARECLLLQIDAALAGDLRLDASIGADDEHATIAPPDVLRNTRTLVEHHLDDLVKNRLPKVAEKTGLSIDDVKRAIEAMRRLSLAPGKRLSIERPEPITPDVIVEYDEIEDRYFAYLNEARAVDLRLNREYAMMAKDRAVPKADRDFLKKNLSNAQWLIEAVEQRRQTLLRVVNMVIAEQRAYFDEGPEALRPLPMTQVAEQLGVHVATVSRAVSDKWLATPRGTVPLRGFFTGGLSTESGEEMSYDAVRAALREVVDAEDKARPMSDEALAKALQERGIDIARRTVAKYRGMMDIPPARLRRAY